jgi:hypothetical protein
MRDGRGAKGGEYTRLTHKTRGVVMSDTEAEQLDHAEAAWNAEGNVLIVGLGIGMVLDAVASKATVQHVHVIEVEQDVVDLVWPHYAARYGDKVSIEVCDALRRKPKKDERYDYIWWDIWDAICGDNYHEMKALKKRWASRCPMQGFWAWLYVRRAAYGEPRDPDDITALVERMKPIHNPVLE